MGALEGKPDGSSADQGDALGSMVTADAVLRRVLGQMSASCPGRPQYSWAKSAWIGVQTRGSTGKNAGKNGSGGKMGPLGSE